jgi:small-conductance mechanosensitive channel
MNIVKKYLDKLSFLAMGVVYAVEPGEQITIPQPEILPKNLEFSTVLSGLISMIIIVSFLAAFFYLLWGGFSWITSGGDEAGIAAARQRIIHALLGLIIVVAVWALFQLVEKFLGVEVFSGKGFKVPVISGPD